MHFIVLRYIHVCTTYFHSVLLQRYKQWKAQRLAAKHAAEDADIVGIHLEDEAEQIKNVRLEFFIKYF